MSLQAHLRRTPRVKGGGAWFIHLQRAKHPRRSRSQRQSIAIIGQIKRTEAICRSINVEHFPF